MRVPAKAFIVTLVSLVTLAFGIAPATAMPEDLSLYEVSQAASEITSAAPNAEVLFGATVDPVYTGRTQVILVVTGIETGSVEVLKPEVSFRRPVAPVRAPEPVAVEVPAAAAHAKAHSTRRKPWFGSCANGTGPKPFQPLRRSWSSPRW